MPKIIETKFNEFSVYSTDNNHSLFHVDIADTPSFYEKMFDYFFQEERFLKYIENKTALSFNPTISDYMSIYKRLSLYVDDENISRLPSDIEADVLRIMCDEYTLEDKGDGYFEVRLDKVGKIGEYIFCNLLSEYFEFDCIIPKANLTTDRNMSVYGIDSLFYSPKKKLVLFGESKVSKSLANGIGLINKSLSTYQKQVDEEFVLILSQRWLRDKMGMFSEDFGDISEICLTMSDFIKKAGVESIGIPVFIAHGGDYSVDSILKQLNSIHKVQIYGLDTILIAISLPVINKSKLIATFTQKILERRSYYETFIT